MKFAVGEVLVMVPPAVMSTIGPAAVLGRRSKFVELAWALLAKNRLLGPMLNPTPFALSVSGLRSATILRCLQAQPHTSCVRMWIGCW